MKIFLNLEDIRYWPRRSFLALAESSIGTWPWERFSKHRLLNSWPRQSTRPRQRTNASQSTKAWISSELQICCRGWTSSAKQSSTDCSRRRNCKVVYEERDR